MRLAISSGLKSPCQPGLPKPDGAERETFWNMDFDRRGCGDNRRGGDLHRSVAGALAFILMI